MVFLYFFCWRKRKPQAEEVEELDAEKEQGPTTISPQVVAAPFTPLKYGGQAEPMMDHTYGGTLSAPDPAFSGQTAPAPTYASTFSGHTTSSDFEADSLYRPGAMAAGGPSAGVPRSNASPSSAYIAPSARFTGTPPIGDAAASTAGSQGRTYEQLESDVHKILAQMKDMKRP